MAHRQAERALEVKAPGEKLAQARVQFEPFQEAIAAQWLGHRRTFDRVAGQQTHDLACAQQRKLAQQATLAQQDTRLGQLRADHDASAGEARAARLELAAVRADREQLTRQITEAAGYIAADAAKLEKVNGDLVEAGTALAAPRRQTELLEDRLAGMTAERDQLARDKLALAQDNAVLRERVRAASAKTAGESDG